MIWNIFLTPGAIAPRIKLMPKPPTALIVIDILGYCVSIKENLLDYSAREAFPNGDLTFIRLYLLGSH